MSGSAYVTPGDNHLQIEKNQNGPIIHLNQEKRVNGHRPSIDVTIMSGVEIYGREIAAMLMTGMGRDGVLGMKKLYDSGGLTLAQNEESSVVFGMNRRAIELGVVDRIIAIDSFGSVIKEFFGGESN